MNTAAKLLLLVVLTAVPAAQADAAVKLSPEADNWLSSCPNSYTANMHSDSIKGKQNRVRTSNFSCSTAYVRNFHTLLNFNLSSYSDSSEIISAKLKMYFYSGDTSGRTYNLHRVTNSWSESASSWVNRDGSSQWDSMTGWDNDPNHVYQYGGGDYDATVEAFTVMPSSTDQWVEWDITDLVKDWIDGTDNYGLIIMDSDEFDAPWETGQDKEDYMCFFRGNEYGSTAEQIAQRPYLEIVPEPTSMTLLGVAAATMLLRRRRAKA